MLEPTVATERQFRFVVNTRENLFEPPHVHVWVASEDVCRIQLNNASYMDNPPPGLWREILDAYRKHAATICQEWDRIHRR